jgi:hypothetical protein
MTQNATPQSLGDHGLSIVPGQKTEFTYTNWRGKVAQRRVIPISIWYGATSWHPEPQWLLRAVDIDKWEQRDFALKDIVPITPSEATQALGA